MDFGSGPGAAPDFAVDDSRADGLFGTPVGGIDGRVAEEREQVVEMVFQVFGKSFVGGVRFERCDESPHARFEAACQHEQAVCGQFFLFETIAGRQCFPEQVQHGARESHLSTDGGFQQFVAAAHQVRQTLLMHRLLEAVVDAPADVNQRAGVIFAQQPDGRLTAACGIDHIAGDLFRDEVVPPGVLAIDPPAGFIAHRSRRTTHVLADQIVRRPQCGQLAGSGTS